MTETTEKNAEDAVEQPSTAERLADLFESFNKTQLASGVPECCDQLKLTGDSGGDYKLQLGGGNIKVEAGCADSAEVSVTLSAEDLVSVADGKYDGRLLVASERIVVEGDQDLALAMGALFSGSSSD